MRKGQLERKSTKNNQYLLIKITSPDGTNLLDEEGCKKLINELNAYIINGGGQFYKEESIVLIEARELINLRGFENIRYIRIPRGMIKSGRINPRFKYNVVMFETTELYSLEI